MKWKKHRGIDETVYRENWKASRRGGIGERKEEDFILLYSILLYCYVTLSYFIREMYGK